MPGEGVLRAGDMEFWFPELADGAKDNIACSGETITAPEGRYVRIMVLGCGDEGSFSEKMVVNYQDGTVEEIYLEFSCWWLPTDYNETIACTGKLTSRLTGKVHITTHFARLYAQSYPLRYQDRIKSITLPDCPNLHIFGISLGEDAQP